MDDNKTQPQGAVDPSTGSADAAIDMIRGWLKQGCTIKASDVYAPVLQQKADGSWIGGLTIERSNE